MSPFGHSMDPLKIEYDNVSGSPNEVYVKINQISEGNPEDIWPPELASPSRTMIAMGQSTAIVPCPVHDLGLVLKIAPETVKQLRNTQKT
jgi:hypothetical protein